MKKIIYASVFILCLGSITGCSFFHKHPKVPKTSPVVVKPSETTQPIKGIKGHIILKDRLKKGGTIAVVPFSAGVDIVASDQVDWIALQIAKGITDKLSQSSETLTILSSDRAQEADFVIKGRIVQLNEKQGMKFWPKKSKIYAISVEGMVVAGEEEEVVAKFSQSEQSRTPEVSFLTLGYRIGQGIGEFLLNGSK